jgi:hypothetical protein
MTKAMKRKFKDAVISFQNEHPEQYVHDCYFHHYGEDYRIEENETEYKIFRVCKTDIYNTLIETITK